MFVYEREDKELSSAMTSNHYPELAAIKNYKIKWLISQLEAAGLMPFSDKTDQYNEPTPAPRKYLCGYHTERHIPGRKADLLLKHLNKDPGLTLIEYTHAKFGKQKFGKIFTYRGSKFEAGLCRNDNVPVKESSCVIHTTKKKGFYVGEIQYFVQYQSQELAFIKWYGIAKQDAKFFSYFVDAREKLHDVEEEFVSIDFLGPPLMYSWEDNVLWMPKFF